jgi:hypothetical protein
VGRASRSRAAFDMAATAASSWILAATASSRPSRLEFYHSSPTFGPGILAATMGTSSCWASPTMGNASVDVTDAAAASTFFFATDGKTCVSPFNCYIRNTSKCRMIRLLIHLCLQASFFIDRTQLHQCSSKHGRIQ